MKKIFSFTILFMMLTVIATAQKTQLVKKADTAKVQTLKVTPENTYVKPLPDLRLTALSFSLVSSQVVDGVTTYTFQINYTVKNDGTLAVAANSVFLQGYIHYGGSAPRTAPGCGSGIPAPKGEMINPGAERSASFRCTAPLDRNNPPQYTLNVDSDNLIKESNKGNNSVKTTILF